MEAGRSYREDDSLKRGEAQIYQLQQQVDELRRLLREQMARQNSVEEYLKQGQSVIVTVRDQVDKQTAEFHQAFQVRVLEEHRIKQELAELQVRSTEPIKPLRELRSQITQLFEQRRREGEQVGVDKQAVEKVATMARDTQAHIGRRPATVRRPSPGSASSRSSTRTSRSRSARTTSSARTPASPSTPAASANTSRCTRPTSTRR